MLLALAQEKRVGDRRHLCTISDTRPISSIPHKQPNWWGFVCTKLHCHSTTRDPNWSAIAEKLLFLYSTFVSYPVHNWKLNTTHKLLPAKSVKCMLFSCQRQPREDFSGYLLRHSCLPRQYCSTKKDQARRNERKVLSRDIFIPH